MSAADQPKPEHVFLDAEIGEGDAEAEQPESPPLVEVLEEASPAGTIVPVGDRIPTTLLALPLRNAVAFPGMMMPVLLETERARETVAKVEKEGGYLALLRQKDLELVDPTSKDLEAVGIAARVLKTFKLPDGKSSAMVQGLRRLRVLRFAREAPFLIAKVQLLQDVPGDPLETAALVRNLQFLLKGITEKSPMYGEEFGTVALNIEPAGGLADFAAAYFVHEIEQRQRILEEIDISKRLLLVVELLTKEVQVLELGQRIQEEIREKTEKLQKEYFLREQIKIIRRELGEETDARLAELQRLEEAVAKAGIPEPALTKAQEEIERLQTTPAESPEYTVLRNYLDWLVSLPWSKSTEDRRNLVTAQKVLDEDHFGLDEIKERILEFLAVRKLKPEHSGSILCFVGPPGVGKTSLGRSIARAMGRKFWRFSLGGMRDEAEIKGHRRTYIGAMPGRIMQGLKLAGSNNPVIMLDELDKLGSDFRGDPSSALLEVLDPEQNHAFVDHYLDVPFDLSRVMFIATANALPMIPGPLRDRMEIIEIPGYITEEKVEIALRHLLPKQIQNHGLSKRRISVGRAAIQRIIQDYTHEAGVRGLEKCIARLCRKASLKVARGHKSRISVAPGRLTDFLGLPRAGAEGERRVRIPGVAQGLSWTPFGGDVLFIEAARYDGKGSFSLTGQLGEVMSESGRIAMHYVRANANRYGVADGVIEKSDLHVHFPAGAIPKDGPSAGITIATALLSLLTGKRCPADLAMTGELTLVGEVLPIGGVREKVLAAKRQKLKRVVLPAENRAEVEEIRKDLVRGLRFVYVEVFDEVFAEVFATVPRTQRGRAAAKPRLRQKTPPKKPTRTAKRTRGERSPAKRKQRP